jgi:lysophospholipase L1-like esterase
MSTTVIAHDMSTNPGLDLRETWVFTNSAGGAAFDVGTATIALYDRTGAVTTVATVTIGQPTVGTVTVTLPAAQALLLYQAGKGAYRYEVNFTISGVPSFGVAGVLQIMDPGYSISSSGTTAFTANVSGTSVAVAVAVAANTASAVAVADTALNFPGPASAKNVEVELAQLRTFDLNTIAVNDWPPNLSAASRYIDVSDPALCSSTMSPSTQRIELLRFTVTRKITINTVTMAADTTASASLTTGVLGIYAVGDDGQSWPFAQSANDTALFGTIQTIYNKAFSTTGGWPASITLTPGRCYAVACLLDGVTMPTWPAYPAVRNTMQAMHRLRRSGLATSFLGNVPTADASLTQIPFARVYEGGSTNLARSVVLLGDSFFASFPAYVGLGIAQGGSRLHVIRNKGVGGETLANFYARWTTDVLAYSPEWVMIGGASNDIFAEGVDAATVISRYQTIINAAAAAGINLLITTPGSNTAATAGQKTTLGTVRTFLLGLTSTSSLKVCDTGITLTTGDGVTADASKLTDTTHPNAAGLVVLAAALATTVATIT